MDDPETNSKSRWVGYRIHDEISDNCNNPDEFNFNQASCHSISYTNQTYFKCVNGYTGDLCDEQNNITMEDIEVIKENLKIDESWVPLPTLISVWYEVEDLQKKLQDIVEDVATQVTEEIQFLIKYEHVFALTKYLVDLGTDL